MVCQSHKIGCVWKFGFSQIRLQISITNLTYMKLFSVCVGIALSGIIINVATVYIR